VVNDDFDDYYGVTTEEESKPYASVQTNEFSGSEIIYLIIESLVQDGHTHEVALYINGEVLDMNDLIVSIKTTTAIQ
tara:strand:+ start:119 stop:349 length:231 start_codon:yes stop_codon:yes gene_type:complete